MKKFLSLVLALVMTMSLVTISAGAKDFDDNGDIDYKEAVDVISALGIVDGYSDDSFRPDGSLTRGAAAKIICNLILGPTTASALSATTAPFKDVPTTNVFAGYITYCAQQGIISGYGDGTFRPTGSLTGNAFLKMLLGALGYDSSIEGYTGSNWQVNVTKQAVGIGLNKGNDEFVGSKTVTRQEACLYAFNMLQADMVQYDSKTTVNVNGATVTIAGDKAQTVSTANGWVGTNDGNIGTRDGVQQFAEKYFDKLELRSGTDDFARPANVWNLNSDRIGVYAKEADASYTSKVEVGQIYKDLGLSKNVAKDDVEVYVDGVLAADHPVSYANYDADFLSKQVPLSIKRGDDDNKYGANGVLTEVFFDEDTGKVTITEISTYVGQVNKNVAATAKKDAYVQIATLDRVPGKTGNLDFETDETFEEDSYVQFTYSEAAEEIKSVAATEEVSGTATKTVNKVVDGDENRGMTIGDTDYKVSQMVSGELLSNVSVDNDYTIYLDQYGYILYIEEAELTADDYALVLATANRGSFVGKKAELVFANGTSDVVTTDKDYSNSSNGVSKYDIVSFKVDEDGVYTLKPVKPASVAVGTLDNNYALNTDGSTTFSMQNDKAGITIGGGKSPVTANSKTVFVVRDPSDYDTYTSYTGIKSAPTIKAGDVDDNSTVDNDEYLNVYYYCKSNNMATVMFIFPGSGLTVEDDNNTMLYLAGESVSDLQHDRNSSYFEYNAIVNNEITTVKVDENVTVVNGATGTGIGTNGDGKTLNGLYASYSVDKYGVITKVTGYDKYTGASDAKAAINNETGLNKRSADYTVILGTKGGSNITISVDDNATYYTVDKNGDISTSSYRSVVKDDDDKVFAAVKDYLVQTLIVESVNPTSAAQPATVTIAPSDPTVTVGASLTLTANVALADARHDEIVSYQWYKGSVAPANKVGTNSATYTVDTSAPAVATDYFCVVTTYNDSVSGKDTVSATSSACTVTVNAAAVNLLVNKTGAAASAIDVAGAGRVAENTAAKLTLTLNTDAYASVTVDVSVNGTTSSYTVNYGTPQDVYVPVSTSDVVVTLSVSGTPIAKHKVTLDITELSSWGTTNPTDTSKHLITLDKDVVSEVDGTVMITITHKDGVSGSFSSAVTATCSGGSTKTATGTTGSSTQTITLDLSDANADVTIKLTK